VGVPLLCDAFNETTVTELTELQVLIGRGPVMGPENRTLGKFFAQAFEGWTGNIGHCTEEEL
jgi:hypothetical protein